MGYDKTCHSCSHATLKGSKIFCDFKSKRTSHNEVCADWDDACLVKCLICNQYLRALPIHLSIKHNINTEQYKETYGYNRNTGLVSETTHVKMSKEAKLRIENGIVRAFDGNETIPPEKRRGASRRREYKEHISNLFKGKKFTDEHKEKIRLAATGRKLSEETKTKLRVPKSEEHKKKLSEARKRFYAQNALHISPVSSL